MVDRGDFIKSNLIELANCTSVEVDFLSRVLSIRLVTDDEYQSLVS